VYLAPRPESLIAGRTARDLWEWRSIPYADGEALYAMPDITLRNNLIEALTAQGVTEAVSVRASTPSAAFFQLSPNPPWILPAPDRRISERSARRLTGPAEGRASDAFIQSISPNTGGTFVHAFPVPALAVPEGEFPSGFETRIWETPDGRKTSARIVQAATGRFKGVGAYMNVVTVASGDRRAGN
jgi:hypothetical protein